MGAKATGHYTMKSDGLYLQFDRLFRAPIEDVWYSLTNPTALKSWIGTYTGIPGTGAVRFRMTAEGEDAKWQNVTILGCDAPHGFRIDVGDEQPLRLHCHLVEGSGMTTLTLAQRVAQRGEVAQIGPGWDYYLDRLAAARHGDALPRWEDYFPALRDQYAELQLPEGAHR